MPQKGLESEDGFPWQKMEGPKLKFSSYEGYPSDKRDYQTIFAADDGSLILSVSAYPYDGRLWPHRETSATSPPSDIYLWDGKSWRTKESKYGAASRLCTSPCRGWEMFGAVKSLVKGLQKPKDGPGGVID
jgi:hypothetical protein